MSNFLGKKISLFHLHHFHSSVCSPLAARRSAVWFSTCWFRCPCDTSNLLNKSFIFLKVGYVIVLWCTQFKNNCLFDVGYIRHRNKYDLVELNIKIWYLIWISSVGCSTNWAYFGQAQGKWETVWRVSPVLPDCAFCVSLATFSGAQSSSNSPHLCSLQWPLGKDSKPVIHDVACSSSHSARGSQETLPCQGRTGQECRNHSTHVCYRNQRRGESAS